jgi:tetratricopeptide (TPR) repeat protein/WD40 repeat protein
VRLKTALDDTQKAERKARLREAEALVGKAHSTRYSRRVGQRFEALAALEKAVAIGRELGQPPEWFDRLRNEAIAALALPDIHITHSWPGFPPDTYRAELSHDFKLYARTTRQGDCSVRRVADDVEIARLPKLGESARATFGPGRLLVFYGESSGRCQLWDLAGPEPVRRIDQQHAHHWWGFGRDGRLFALAYRDRSVRAYATDTGVCRYRLTPSALSDLSLHPTEPVVATFSYFSPLVQVRDLRTGAVLVSLSLPWRGSGMCAWSPDGRTLAVPDGDNSGLIHLYTFDPLARSLRLTRALRGPDMAGACVHFNPAGDRLASRGWGGHVHLFDVHTGRLLFSTPSKELLGGARLRFDPTGKRLAAARVGPRLEQIGLWSVADAREYRALFHDSAQHRHHDEPGAVHPDGRLAAAVFADGLALFDLETGRKLEVVRVPRGVGRVFFDGAGNLLTNGFAGFFRWPVRPDPTQPGRLTVGPPERLPFHPGNGQIAASRDGQVIAQPMFAGYGEGPYAGGWILHPSTPKPRRVEAGTGMHGASVSPDGRWVAFGQFQGIGRVNVYEAATGRRVWQSPHDGNHYCRFSRDGHWLVTDNDGGRAYRVGTWEPGPRLGAGAPWDVSPDSRLVVLALAEGVYRLVELATGRELARLEDPEQFPGRAVFTPDGTRLVVTAKDGLRVWDLRRIRAELVKLGLDWDAPPYPEGHKAAPGPIEVRVVGAELIDPKKMAEQQRDRAVFDLYLNPFDGKAHYRLGTHLLGAGKPGRAYSHLTAALAFRPDLPEARHQRARAALWLKRWADAAADASRYLDRDPDSRAMRYLRAKAFHSLGRHADAIADLTAALARAPGTWSYLELRAACYDALGEKEKARADRQKADAILQSASPRALNNTAWRLVTGPVEQRDPPRALRLIQEAMRRAPDNALYLNTLGVVQYRNGQYRESVATLEKSLARGQGQADAFDLFFLAMCHHRLGDAAQAKDCFARAVKWWQGQKNLSADHAEELKTFQAEAEALLRRDKP